MADFDVEREASEFRDSLTCDCDSIRLDYDHKGSDHNVTGALEDLLTRCRDATEEACAAQVEDWLKWYSTDIFASPEPKQHGKTVDQCSAAVARHLIPAIAKDIRERRRRREEG